MPRKTLKFSLNIANKKNEREKTIRYLRRIKNNDQTMAKNNETPKLK